LSAPAGLTHRTRKMEHREEMLADATQNKALGEGEPIARRTLHHDVLDRLRRMIFDGELPANSKVRENDLCERFGVSRTPMREALKVLANEGLVRLTPNRGAVISELTLQDLEDAFPVMGALEALAGELACVHITDQEIAEIRTLHERMVACYENRQLAPYFELNQEIHLRIMQAARNHTLSGLSKNLGDRLRRARYMANISTTRWAQAIAEHAAILAALEQRDGPKLGELMKSHLAHKLDTVRQVLGTPHS
jgi:DNA-binding GntR family transcriptional regulator